MRVSVFSLGCATAFINATLSLLDLILGLQPRGIENQNNRAGVEIFCPPLDYVCVGSICAVSISGTFVVLHESQRHAPKMVREGTKECERERERKREKE